MTGRLPSMVLFDYGGVLLRLNDPVAHFGIGESLADFSKRWLLSEAVQAHETGRIDIHEFSRRIVRDMNLPYSPAEFVGRFDTWPDRVLPDTAALVAGLPASVDCAILSNTNARHWQAQNIARDFSGRISTCFLSFETGFVKPDPAAFSHVLRHVGIAPADILFIDDNPLNLRAAELSGMRARHCHDVDALQGVLKDAGLAR